MPNDNRPMKKREKPEPWPYQTLLERIVQKKWPLKDSGPPQRVALFLGLILARYSRRTGHEPLKQECVVLGKKMNCCRYPCWWWERNGDTIVEFQLARLKEHPEFLAELPGDKKEGAA